MKLKKWFFLLLALVMVLSLAACGEDTEEGGDKKPGKDSTIPTTTVPAEDDTVWVLVRESDMGSSRYNRYTYDAEGNLVSGEFYKDGKVWGNYQYTTTPTANGGKIVEEFYKHVNETEYTKYNEFEFDAAGRLIRTQDYDYQGKATEAEYRFTYNEAGQLVEQVFVDEGQVEEKLTFVYDGDKLMEGHYEEKNGSYGHYIYTYDANGNPLKIDVHTDYMDEQEYTLDLEMHDYHDYGYVKATDECHYVVGGRKLFYYEVEKEGDEVCAVNVQLKSWGIFHTGWLPLVSFGCITPSNYFMSSADLRFEPLDVHLAEQAGK